MPHLLSTYQIDQSLWRYMDNKKSIAFYLNMTKFFISVSKTLYSPLNLDITYISYGLISKESPTFPKACKEFLFPYKAPVEI